MSLKDDFLEALRSVKRDFLKDYEYNEPPAAEAFPAQAAPALEGGPAQQAADAGQGMSDEEIGALLREREGTSGPSEDLHIPPPTLELVEDDEDAIAPDVDPTPFRTAEEVFSGELAERTPPESTYIPSDDLGAGGEPPAGGRIIFDSFDSVDSDERTVISRNTVIRGALQTEDSMRVFGQILGDIDCKSNILVAGKVRGNTSAANAYVINAQVDGNLLCDDAINISDDAWILGNIRAQQADVDGKIKGNIEIRHTISIGSNSSIIGNISTDELEIKRGAFVNGQVMMYSPSRDVIDRFDRFDQ